MIKPEGSLTSSVEETVKLLLDTLVPHCEMSPQEPSIEPNNYIINPCSDTELKEAAWKSATDKAPGNDLLTFKIIRVAWPLISDPLLDLVNDCLTAGLFPSTWKHAKVVTIRKSADKDQRLPKSFRPISLLPSMAKILERIIVNRLQIQIGDALSKKQFGYTKQLSTIDAIASVKNY